MYNTIVSSLTDAKHTHGVAAVLVAKLQILRQLRTSLQLL